MNRLLNIKFALGFILLALLMIPATVSVEAAPGAMPALDVFLTNCVGSYYNNISLSGSPVWTNTNDTVNHLWGENVSPGPGVNTAYYSVGWSCSVTIPANGTYTVTAVTDDGMNILVDGSLMLWAWYDQGPTTYVKTGYLSAGTHTINVQYYNNTLSGTAQVSINTGSSTSSFPNWEGDYFNNTSLSGSPVLKRNDGSINFNWGLGSPDPSVIPDNFSVRWTSSPYFNAGNWQFTTTTDDGVRLWVDGNLIIDHWVDQSATSWSNTVYLAAGNHSVRMEYYDHTLYALAQLNYSQGSGVPPPSGDIIVDDRGVGWQAGGCYYCWYNAGGYGGHSFWTYNNTFAVYGYNWARWYPTLPAARNYEVFAYIPGGIATTTNARYWIYHAGYYNLAARGQIYYPNQWVSLGTYYFNGYGGENVSLSDVTGECYLCRTLVFDAMKFSPR